MTEFLEAVGLGLREGFLLGVASLVTVVLFAAAAVLLARWHTRTKLGRRLKERLQELLGDEEFRARVQRKSTRLLGEM
jgi:hypothetical protein